MKNTDLTEGNPFKVLFLFSIPMLIGNFFQQTYNLVDSLVLGQCVGTSALAAVGAATPVTLLAVAVAQGLGNGIAVVIGQLFGAKQIRELKITITTALITIAVVSICLTFVGTFLAKPMLRLLGTPSAIIDESYRYLQIFFLGTCFLFSFNTLNGIFTAMGDSKTPLCILGISVTLNVALDFYFVLVFSWGVAGVAFATLISRAMSSAVCLFLLYKRYHTLEESPTTQTVFFSASSARRIANIGIPSILQQSIVSLSSMCMQSLVNTHGDIYVGGYTAATRVDNIAILPNANWSNATASYGAQNVGARKLERIPEGIKASITMVLITSVIIGFLCITFTPDILSLFLVGGKDNPSMAYGVTYLRGVAKFYPIMGVLFIINGLFRGVGAIRHFMIASGAQMVARVIFAYSLTPIFAEGAIWISIPMGWIIGSCLAIYFYKKGVWKTRIAMFPDIESK